MRQQRVEIVAVPSRRVVERVEDVFHECQHGSSQRAYREDSDLTVVFGEFTESSVGKTVQSAQFQRILWGLELLWLRNKGFYCSYCSENLLGPDLAFLIKVETMGAGDEDECILELCFLFFFLKKYLRPLQTLIRMFRRTYAAPFL